MIIVEKLIVFGVLSIVVVYFSRRNLFSVRSHGFYRFLSWECIAWLLASNFRVWFVNPFRIFQIGSWLFLFVGLYLVISGAILLKKKGKPNKDRAENNLYNFEKTSSLVKTGIYKYIRHPLYASLIFLTWGIFLKNVKPELFVVAVISNVCLYFTALYDEKECIRYFGDAYTEYMKTTRRFIPFLF